MKQKPKWVKAAISALNNVEPKSKDEKDAIDNAIHVFTAGSGFILDGLLQKYFPWTDLNDRDARK